MFENWANLEGTYVNPLDYKEGKTDIEEVKRIIKEKNPEINEAILERLEIVEVKYLSKNNKVYKGQIVVDQELVNDIVALFDYIQEINNDATKDSEKFFLETVIPITNKIY